MPVKIRLQRHGRKQRPFYHIVIADARAPRDGKFIEKVGTYNPLTVPATIDIDVDRSVDWLQKGAQPTNTVRAILRFKGVLYKKHLLRGVKKGAMTMEQAEAKFQAWIEEHANAIMDRQAKVKKDKEDATAKLIEAETAVRKAKEAAKAPVVEEEEVAEEATEEASAEEEAPVEAPEATEEEKAAE